MWGKLRGTLKEYGFGRHELLPIRSTGEAISKYLGKYVSKNVAAREERDKGARLVRYIGYKPGERRWMARFAWGGRQDPDNRDQAAPCNPLAEATIPNQRAWVWRQKVGAWAAGQGMQSLEDVKRVCGPRWAYTFQDAILGTPLPDGVRYPSEEAKLEALDQVIAKHARQVTAMSEHQARASRDARSVPEERGRAFAAETWEQRKRRELREGMDDFEGHVIRAERSAEGQARGFGLVHQGLDELEYRRRLRRWADEIERDNREAYDRWMEERGEPF